MAWLNPFAANPTRPVLPAPSPGVRTRVGEPNILNNNVFARPAPATPRPEPKRARGAAPTPLSRRLVLHETPDRPLDEIEESDGEGDLDLRLADSPSTPLPPAPGQMPGQCSTPMPASTSGARTNPALAPPPSRSDFLPTAREAREGLACACPCICLHVAVDVQVVGEFAL